MKPHPSWVGRLHTDEGYTIEYGDDVEDLPEYKSFNVISTDDNYGNTSVIILPNDDGGTTVGVIYTSSPLPLKVLPVLDGFKTGVEVEKLDAENKLNDLMVCPSSVINSSVRSFWFSEFGCVPDFGKP